MSADEIDLWQFPLDGDPNSVNAALGFLCPAERSHFRRFENARLSGAFAIRRAARRIILARYLGVAPSEVRTFDAPTGKPELHGPQAGLHFNASNSKDRGILAVTRQFSVGADIEYRRRVNTLALAKRVLSPPERLEFDHAGTNDREAGIFGLWTAKEAVVKGIGVGLDLGDLPLISLPFVAAPATWKLVQFGGRMKVHDGWFIYSLAPSEEYFVSVAAPAETAVRVIDARRILARQGL